MVACAAIVGDQVYVPCLNGQLVSVDRKTGKQQWSYRSIESKNPNDFAPGFKAAPTVTNELVYIGDEDGMMHAIDRRTGKAKWKFRTGAEIAGSVALYGDKLVFGSHDSFLYCLKASDHTPAWKPFQTENFINCSTAIEADNTFIAGCDTKVRVINLISGKQVSEVPLGEGAYLIASPAVMGDVLYVGTHDGRVVAVDWRKQKVVWTYTDENHLLEYRSSAAVTDKYVILGGYDKELHCLDRQNGKPGLELPDPCEDRKLPRRRRRPDIFWFRRRQRLRRDNERQVGLERTTGPFDHSVTRRRRALPRHRHRREWRDGALLRVQGVLKPGVR